MTFSLDSSIGQIYSHPAGRDVIDKILLQVGAPRAAVTNVIVRNLRLGALKYVSLGKLDNAFLQALIEVLNTRPDSVSEVVGEAAPAWWKEAVFYQIYPRSFQDSDGDGIGDLAGITSRLDYLVGLGVNALWLSPIYDSPNDDNGYDIRDYRAIMAEFGTLDDFENLVQQAHARGLRIVMDLVVNHTSDEHEWFQRALQGDPRYRDYYFFRPVTTPGRPPNNWVSFFSGPAWRYFPQIDQWALHLFSPKQMDLNWENPQVRQEVADIAKFWIDRGVDGFRLDVINYISKRPELPDGNPLIGQVIGFSGIEHYFYGPHLHEYLAQLNRTAFAPTGTFSVGETPGIGHQVGKLLTDPQRHELDLIFSFDHLETPGHVRMDDYRYDLNYLKHYFGEAQGEFSGQYWMSLFFENHDNPRMISKVNADPRYRKALGKLLGGILMTLRGTPFIYQGQELGLVNHDFGAIEELRDVESLNLYAELLKTDTAEEAFGKVLVGSRDHARTPMPWDGSAHAGFSTGTAWIKAPLSDAPADITVESQMGDQDSVLEFYRRLIALRRDSPDDLIYGPVEFLDAGVLDYWAYRRGKSVLVQMNLGEQQLPVDPEWQSAQIASRGRELLSSGADTAGVLAPYEFRITRI